eukprot:COSAG02_NODE_2332_length_9118_cov_1.999556_6_plen_63_part_00
MTAYTVYIIGGSKITVRCRYGGGDAADGDGGGGGGGERRCPLRRAVSDGDGQEVPHAAGGLW